MILGLAGVPFHGNASSRYRRMSHVEPNDELWMGLDGPWHGVVLDACDPGHRRAGEIAGQRAAY